jgi:hypothetical protein
MGNMYKILVVKPEGNRSLGRPMHRWEDIRMSLTEMGWKGVNQIHLAQDTDQ